MTKKERKKYQVREVECYTRECFLPFTGNGLKICRLYEMGRCPEKYNKALHAERAISPQMTCTLCGKPGSFVCKECANKSPVR